MNCKNYAIILFSTQNPADKSFKEGMRAISTAEPTTVLESLHCLA